MNVLERHLRLADFNCFAESRGLFHSALGRALILPHCELTFGSVEVNENGGQDKSSRHFAGLKSSLYGGCRRHPAKRTRAVNRANAQ